jgi:hypothetical protein
MNKLFILFLSFPAVLFSQNLYIGKVFNQKKEILSYTKIYSGGKIFNTDSTGTISGSLTIGDTLVFPKREFSNNIHIVKNLNEQIILNEIYTEIEEVKIEKKEYSKEFIVKKDKERSYYSLRNSLNYGFKYKNDKYIIFNTIEIPIKFVSNKNGNKNTNTQFSIQFFKVDENNQLPSSPLSEKINFIVDNRSQIKIKLNNKIIIPNESFFVVLEANENSSVIIDKKSWSFNPYFLCNVQGEKGSYLEYDIKKGEWEILDGKRDVSWSNINLIINLKMVDK